MGAPEDEYFLSDSADAPTTTFEVISATAESLAGTSKFSAGLISVGDLLCGGFLLLFLMRNRDGG